MNVEEIFKEFNIRHEKEPEHYKVTCPFHNDTNPSGRVHNKTKFFNCFSCGKKTSFIVYLCQTVGITQAQARIRLGAKSDCKRPISPAEIEVDHALLWTQEPLLDQLHQRCITDDLIRKYRIGFKEAALEKRISIPIVNDVGEYVNLRLYLPGASTRKFLNYPSQQDNYKVRLFPVEQLEYDQILVCGGELKAIAAASVLNKYDIGAVSPTIGETFGWPHDYNHRFQGKLIYVCSDIDEAGMMSMENRCKILKSFGRAIHKVILPLDSLRFPKGDINDFLHEGGDLYKCLLDTPEWEYLVGGQTPVEFPTNVSFKEAYKNDNVGKRITFTGMVTGFSQNQYNIPSIVEVKCPRGQEFCLTCDVNSQSYSTNTEMPIGPEHRVILALINEADYRHPLVYKDCFHIPRACTVCTFERKKEYTINEVRLEEQIEVMSREEPAAARVGYIVNSSDMPDNQSYKFIGRTYPSPRNQISCFLASNCEPTDDSLDSYKPENRDSFTVFTPKEWTLAGIEEKLDDIYSDLEANITKIYQRRDYHIAIDLVYHSVLYLNLDEERKTKSCLEFLVVGDTSEGKSTVVDRLSLHYGLGYKVDCANLSKAGLTIGLERSGAGFFATYGVLPRNDKRLVILEELSKIPSNEFQALTEARSSGMVQITKIHHRHKHARVRLIAISNPLEGREVGSYTFGIESAMSLIGTNADLRRFDFVMILGKADHLERIFELDNPPSYPHKYDGDSCKKLILKAWKCETIEFECFEAIAIATKRLLAEFGDGPPVLDANSSHVKIAKLATALAARTNSYTDQEALLVRKCHVDYIEKFLTRIYSAPSCRLNEKSKAIRNSTILRNPGELVKYLKTVQNIGFILTKISETDMLTSFYIRDLVGDFMISSALMSKLIQSNAIIRVRKDKYAKNQAFTRLIAETDWGDKPPEYLQREKF